MRLRLAGWLATAALISLPVYGVHAWAQQATTTESTEKVTIEQPGQGVKPQPQQDAVGVSETAAGNGVSAATATTAAVQKAFEKRFPEIDVGGVAPTPFAGLYEVQVGSDLLYVNADVDYILQGSLIDAKRRTDLTAERIDALSRVDFADLPLDIAIKQVKGDGSRVMAIFEDPNCGYCKQLHKTLNDVDNVTIYSFLFPILSPDSTTKARNIWCAEDKAEVWRDWMLRGKKPAEAECETPIEQSLALGRKLNVQGTPAIFFADGSRINGALPLNALKQKLDTLK
ncbi:DsbC family protein [Pusillimonas sp. ANT_WB101]|uniref:DsbC family protein n=1 Tax=Pusillimonas sp. ANT_WB101 TaxID=2597356 RepID=UPI0011EF951D|nr:DsbC family protein [Pusillimonas sp. ANT_WB101]KAA0889451.1 DsbC family protein [Pusillimonas sp. ANT_WB101]